MHSWAVCCAISYSPRSTARGIVWMWHREQCAAPRMHVHYKLLAARVHDPLHSAVQVLCPRASTVCACRVSRMCALYDRLPLSS